MIFYYVLFQYFQKYSVLIPFSVINGSSLVLLFLTKTKYIHLSIRIYILTCSSTNISLRNQSLLHVKRFLCLVQTIAPTSRVRLRRIWYGRAPFAGQRCTSSGQLTELHHLWLSRSPCSTHLQQDLLHLSRAKCKLEPLLSAHFFFPCCACCMQFS